MSAPSPGRSERTTRRLGIAAAALACLLISSARSAEAVDLVVDAPASSDTGHYELRWGPPEPEDGDGPADPLPEGTTFELQEARSADFSGARTIYEGPDRARAMSGRLDGVFHYRVRSPGGAWSAPVTVEVRHHSLTEAFVFLGVGAFVFIATAVLIVLGHRAHRREMAGRQP